MAMSLKSKISSYWDVLSPAHKRIAVIVAGIAAIFIIVSLVNKGDRAINAKDEAIERTKKTVLAETNTRSLGIDALNAELRRVNQELNTANDKITKVTQQLSDMSRRRGNDPDMTREINVVKGQIQSLTNTAKKLGWDVEDIRTGYTLPATPIAIPNQSAPVHKAENTEKDEAVDLPNEELVDQHVRQRSPQDASHYFRTSPVRSVNPDNPNSSAAVQLAIQTFEDPSKNQVLDETEGSVPLLPGTILSGVTINGLRVPTGMNGRKDPFPVLVRLQKEAILPNGYTVDIKECFATLSGYAELATEKVMLRGEQLSCMTEDEKFVDVALPGFINGEDGVAGLSGQLVTRSGSLIARTAVAGFFSGFGEAFDTSRVPSLNTGSVGNDPIFQRNFTKGAAQHGASSGLSESMEKISEYYMKLADQMFPVIEINPGRQVDIILVKTVRLNKQAVQKKSTSATKKVSAR